MKWVKRGLWIALWGAWVWCGIGLHRELPRKLGDPIAVNPWKAATWQDVSYVGFIGDTNQFVVLHKPDGSSTSPMQVAVYDLDAGTIVSKVKGPSYSDLLWNDFFSPEHASLFAKDAPDADERGVFRLDLHSGRWHRVAGFSVERGGVHRLRPWVLLTERKSEARTIARVVVIDWQSGKEVFSRKIPPHAHVVGFRAFFSGDDRVVIPLQEWQEPKNQWVEVWRISDSPELEMTLNDAPIGLFPMFAAGRVTFSQPYGTHTVDVLDLDDGRYVFSNMPRDQRPPAPNQAPGGWRPPVLSSSGKRVLGGDPPTIWDVDSGKEVWRAPAASMAFAESRRDERSP